MSDCLFCKIIAGDIPSNKVYEDDLCYAFNDIAPQAPVHFLVIPKVHIASVAGVSAENSAVVAHIFEVIAKLTKEKGIESYRVVSNIGEQAGQSVPHLHFHVLSGRDMTWPLGLRVFRRDMAAPRRCTHQRGYSLLEENTPFVSPREGRGAFPSTPDIASLRLEGLPGLRNGSAVYVASPRAFCESFLVATARTP